MNGFKKLYIWSMNAKFYMGLYFAALVFLAGILVAIFGGDSLKLITLLQMLLVSMAIAFVQAWVLPHSLDFSRGIFFGRSIAWLVFTGVLTGVVAHWGNWFAGMPAWCTWLMACFTVAGAIAMLVGVKFEQDADTIRLNDALEVYQKDNIK